MTGRSSARPNRCSNDAITNAPPAMPPMKKYSTMYQRQCGDVVKKVSDIGGRVGTGGKGIHAAFAQGHYTHDRHQHRAGCREQGAELEVARGESGIRRQAVHFRVVDEQVERVEPTEE